MLWWLSPTSAAARTTSPLSSSASPDLGRSKEYRSCGKLDSPEGKTNRKMSARVRPQWELRPALARRDQRFAFALPLSADTSAQPQCSPLMIVTARQAAFRTSTSSIRSASRYSTRNGESIGPSHTPATTPLPGMLVAAFFLPEASHAESHESRQEPARSAGKTCRASKDCACAAAREDREDRARAAPQAIARSRLRRRRSRNGGVFSAIRL